LVCRAVLQRDLSEKVTVGGELFYSTPKAVGEGGQTGFNVGGSLISLKSTTCCSQQVVIFTAQIAF